MSLPALIVRLASGLASRRRTWWFRALGTRIAGPGRLGRVLIPREWDSIALAAEVALDDHVVLLSSGGAGRITIAIGANSYINRFTMIDASERIEIGRDCMIGPHCYITDHDHGFAPGTLVRDQPLRGSATRIGDNVWIGAGAIILKGVTIGDDAVVAAGAIVARSVGAGAVVAGVPARSLRNIADGQ